MAKFCNAFLALIFVATWASTAAAQQTVVSTPFHSTGDSFFEQVGVNFGFQRGNFSFHENSAGVATPQFGNFNPSASAATGFSVPLAGGQAFFNITAGQGSQQSMTSQAPSMTVTNGVPGFFSDVSQTPFVISTLPMITMPQADQADAVGPVRERWDQLQAAGGNAPRQRATSSVASGTGGDQTGGTGINGNQRAAGFESRLAAARGSSAGRPTLSVNELKHLRAEGVQQGDSELQAALAQARAAEGAGKANVARIYYEQAARRARGALRDELLAHLDTLSKQATARATTKPRTATSDRP